MKNIFLLFAAIVSFNIASQAQFRIGVKAGGNISHQRVNGGQGNTLFSNDHYKNFHAGLITEVKLADRLFLQPQVLYTRKGSTLLSSTGAPDMKVRINYIEMPVNLVYKLPVSFGYVFGGAGAAFSYGISSKQDMGKNDPWKREDLSLSFTAGVELDNGLFVSINSQKGMWDVYKPNSTSVKNSSVSVSLGYLIDLKNKN